MSAAKKQVSVIVSKDGPYIVSGGPPLTKQTIIANADGKSLQWQEGETYDAPARYALCRCATRIRRRSATAPMHKLALTAPKRQSARPIPRRQPYSTARSLPFWIRSTCARTAGSAIRMDRYGIRLHTRTIRKFGHVSSPGASLSRGAPGRLRQSHRNNDRGEFTCLDRSD